MTDETQSSSPAVEVPTATADPSSTQFGDGASAPASAQEKAVGAAAQVASERPEIVVAGAFAAGFVIAMILKRLGR